MITQSPRTEHIAAHITPEAKRAMYCASRETGKSMSLILSELIDRYIEFRTFKTDHKERPE